MNFRQLQQDHYKCKIPALACITWIRRTSSLCDPMQAFFQASFQLGNPQNQWCQWSWSLCLAEIVFLIIININKIDVWYSCKRKGKWNNMEKGKEKLSQTTAHLLVTRIGKGQKDKVSQSMVYLSVTNVPPVILFLLVLEDNHLFIQSLHRNKWKEQSLKPSCI